MKIINEVNASEYQKLLLKFTKRLKENVPVEGYVYATGSTYVVNYIPIRINNILSLEILATGKEPISLKITDSLDKEARQDDRLINILNSRDIRIKRYRDDITPANFDKMVKRVSADVRKFIREMNGRWKDEVKTVSEIHEINTQIMAAYYSIKSYFPGEVMEVRKGYDGLSFTFYDDAVRLTMDKKHRIKNAIITVGTKKSLEYLTEMKALYGDLRFTATDIMFTATIRLNPSVHPINADALIKELKSLKCTKEVITKYMMKKMKNR